MLQYDSAASCAMQDTFADGLCRANMLQLKFCLRKQTAYTSISYGCLIETPSWRQGKRLQSADALAGTNTFLSLSTELSC